MGATDQLADADDERELPAGEEPAAKPADAEIEFRRGRNAPPDHVGALWPLWLK